MTIRNPFRSAQRVSPIYGPATQPRAFSTTPTQRRPTSNSLNAVDRTQNSLSGEVFAPNVVGPGWIAGVLHGAPLAGPYVSPYENPVLFGRPTDTDPYEAYNLYPRYPGYDPHGDAFSPLGGVAFYILVNQPTAGQHTLQIAGWPDPLIVPPGGNLTWQLVLDGPASIHSDIFNAISGAELPFVGDWTSGGSPDWAGWADTSWSLGQAF